MPPKSEIAFRKKERIAKNIAGEFEVVDEVIWQWQNLSEYPAQICQYFSWKNQKKRAVRA